MSSLKRVDHNVVSRVIEATYNGEQLWNILSEAPTIQAGPFDGGCLVCATALIDAFEGELVCIALNGEDGQAQAMHYGALIGGIIYDFYGGHETESGWLIAFCENEQLSRDNLIVKPAKDVVNDEIPLDDLAVNKLVTVLKKEQNF